MTENFHCAKEEVISTLRSDVQILKKDSDQDERRLTKLEGRLDDLATISTAISVMSLSLEHIVEHNHRQDDLMRNQNQTLERVNENLNRLNQGQSNLESKVEKLESRVDDNDKLHTLDLRGIDKGQQEEYLKKYAGPVAIGIAVGGILVQLISALM